MANTPENAAKAKVKRAIKDICAHRSLPYKIDWHAGSMFTSTVDATGVVAGHAVAIELKRFDGKGKATERQLMCLEAFRAAGAQAFLLDSLQALDEFKVWLENLEPRT